MTVLLAAVATLVAALVGALIGLLVVLPFALLFSELIVYPLAAGFGALLAALAAGWAANAGALDRSTTRLLPVVGVAEACAVLVAGVMLTSFALSVWSRPRVFDVLPIVLAGAGSAVLGAAATGAALRNRSGERRLGRDLRLTLLLLALGAATVLVAFSLAAFVGFGGA